MVQELKCKVAIIGGGPAGCICAYYLQNNFDVTVFDKKSLLHTILPTGGGRCNLAHAQYDYRELASNYPRGEKFLYSVFSKFSTLDTIEFFKNIGVNTYIQDDERIFPISNSSKDVRDKFLKSLNKIKVVHEEVLRINNGFSIVTDKNAYKADYVVISIGGHVSYELIKLLGHKIIEPKPSLTGLVTEEDFSSISGVAINNLLFTHRGISGPAIYRISSLKARDSFPYKLKFNFLDGVDLQKELDQNSHKSIKNLLGSYIPKSFAVFILNSILINPDTKCHSINGIMRDNISNKLQNFEVTVIGTFPEGEVVTSGGVDLKEINPKTMESKLHPKIYFCGEVLDIDGFCGGFNLQNCWSTGFVASHSIINNPSSILYQ